MSDIPKVTLQDFSPSQAATRLLEDAFDTTLKTVKEHPVATTVGAVAVGAGLLYVTRGRSLKTTIQTESTLLKGGTALGIDGAATEKLLASSIPITAETRAAAAAGQIGLHTVRNAAGELKPATDAILRSGIPITAETRAAAASGKVGLDTARSTAGELTPATEALVRNSIPITQESRALFASGRLSLDAVRNPTAADKALLDSLRQAPRPDLGSATEALLRNSVPINPSTRASVAASELGLDASRGLGKIPGAPHDPKLLEGIRNAASGGGQTGDMLASRSIPITPETRALASHPSILPLSPHEKRSAITAADSIVRNGISITSESRALAARPEFLRLPPSERQKALQAALDALK